MQGEAADKLVVTARELAADLIEAIGEGVILHPAHQRVAPRHGGTVGRPWLFTPAAMFNLAGVPVTEVPLGLSGQGLPLGVQVAAGMDRDHVSIAVGLALEEIFGGWVAAGLAVITHAARAGRHIGPATHEKHAARRDPAPRGAIPSAARRHPLPTRAKNDDGDPLPGSPSLDPSDTPTAGLGASFGTVRNQDTQIRSELRPREKISLAILRIPFRGA